jgi:transmembrane protein 64
MNAKALIAATSVIVFLSVVMIAFAGDGSLQLLQRIASSGKVGWVVMALLFVIASFPVPLGTTPLILGSGFLWDMTTGYLVVTTGSMVGASLAFVVCRRMFSKSLAKRLEESPALSAAVKAVDRHAVKLCIFIRFMPIPFGLQNSLFAVSSMPFLKYFAATFVGLTPETLLLLHVGSTSNELVDVFAGDDDPKRKLLLVVQLVFLIGFAILIFWKGRQVFRQIVVENEERLRGLVSPARPGNGSGRFSVDLDSSFQESADTRAPGVPRYTDVEDGTHRPRYTDVEDGSHRG